MRRISVITTVITIVALVTFVAPVSAQLPGTETTVLVNTEAEYLAALATLSGDNSGPHTITLGDDITITTTTDPEYTGAQDLTIDGQAHTLSGNGNSRVLDDITTSPTLRLVDITVTGGGAQGGSIEGGAIRWDGDIDIEASIIAGNEANSSTGFAAGGAIWVSGDLTVTDSVVVDNEAISTFNNGFAGAIESFGTVEISGSTFADNHVEGPTSAGGGAIRARALTTVTNSVFDLNTADGNKSISGGAISHGTATNVHIDSSVFTRNEVTADDQFATGGAIQAAPGTVSVEDTTFALNIASSTTGTANGGAIHAQGGVTVSNSTVATNETVAPTANGALTGGTVDLAHATVSGNTGTAVANVDNLDDSFGSVVADPRGGGSNCDGGGTSGHSYDDDGTCHFVTPTDVNNGPDPRLGPARDNGDLNRPGTEATQEPRLTMFPLLGSPLIDAIPPGDCSVDPELDLDQRGVDRPYGDGCDIGAIEAAFPPHGFGDVSDFYDPTVRWSTSDVNDPAVQNGFPANNTWRQGNNITRYQTVFMLHNEAGAPSVIGSHGLTDVQPFFEEAVRWAVVEGVFTGYNDDTFRGDQPITRAQLTKGKWGFAGQPGGNPPHGFTDVPNGSFFDAAVRWAKANNLVNGFNDNTFRPDRDITRGNATRIDYQLAQNPDAWDDPDQAPKVMLFQPNITFPAS